MSTVAIIGAGMSGIASARACLESGLSPTLFDKRSTVGGIWSGEDAPVFSNLITNTTVFETAYSDLPPSRTTSNPAMQPGDNMFFHNSEVRAYLSTSISTTPTRLRLSTTVQSVLRADNDTWVVVSQKAGEEAVRDPFDKVILAAGFFHTPNLEPMHSMPGGEQFHQKWMHVSNYRIPSQMKGQKVLVVGGSISGCEAAADLSHAVGTEDGPRSVTLLSRICRQVFDKLYKERPYLSRISTRWHYLRTIAGRYGEKEYVKDMQKEVDCFMKNEDYGAPAADGGLKMPFVPRWSVTNWRFFEAIREGRLEWKVGEVGEITEDGVVYKDGEVEQFDRVVFATGYKLELPYLEKEVREMILQPDAHGQMDLYEHTMHPDLNGLAFVGMHPPGTSTIAVVDAQARWVANVFGGRVAAVEEGRMREGIEQFVRMRKNPESHYVVFTYEIVDRAAREGGFEVDLGEFPELTKGLIFGPLVPAQFRMCGVGKREEAKVECEKQLEAGGFPKGDFKVEKEELEELVKVWEALKGKEECPKGLGKAVELLVRENQ